MLYPNYNGKKKYFVVATGDGGASWHTVLAATGINSFSNGIIGPDKNNYLYAYIIDGDGNPKVIKANRIQWQFK